MPWVTAGIQSSPLAGTVLADSGVLAATSLSISVMIWRAAAVPVSLTLHHVGSTALDVHKQRIDFPADHLSHEITLPLTVILNERITITVDNNPNTDVQASLLW